MKKIQAGEPEKDHDQIKKIIVIDGREIVIDTEEMGKITHLQTIPAFSVFNPNIKEAAILVAVDMWFSGMLEEVTEPEEFDGDGSAPWLIVALADTIAEFEVRLSASVDAGRLEASFVRRDFDDQLNPEETHIDIDDLLGWLAEKDYDPADHISDWMVTESEINEYLSEEVFFLRNAPNGGRKELSSIARRKTEAQLGILDESEQLVEVQAALKEALGQVHRPKEELTSLRLGRSEKLDRPLHTRQRRTLLTIIAALCDSAGIDYTERGASQRIKSKTELIGASIDDGTIINLLREIPDALETRMK